MNNSAIDGILSSVLFCSAINAPILIFINDLSKLTIPDIKTSPFLWISIMNFPIIYKHGSTPFYVLYGILVALLVKWHQTINFPLQNTTLLGILLLFMIKNIHNAGIIVGLTTLLNMCIENVISYDKYPIYYSIFYIFAYAWIFYTPKYVGKISKALLTSPQKMAISLIVVLLLSFLYIRNMTELYYGGDLLIANPTSLNKTSSYTVNYAYEYTISCWLNINAMPPSYSLASTEYTNVFYGDDLMVTYNGIKNKLRIMMKTKTNKIVVDVPQYPLQKWNHLLLAYSNGVFDVFMNNVLIKSNTMVSQLTNELVVGAENGISGEICNMLVFTKVLSPETRSSLYNQFKSKTPPTF